MARTLLGERAGQGGRERLHGVPPSSRGAHRPSPAAGGQRRRGRWQRPCAFPILRQGKRAAGPHHALDELFGGAVNQGAVRLLPELALGRRAGGHVQPGEVSQQEEGRTRKKVLKQGGRDGAIRDEPASVRRPPRRPVIASRRP